MGPRDGGGVVGWWERLREDLRVLRARDPAARGAAIEVLATSPGLHAQWAHRLAHRLWRRGVPLLPRLIAHTARATTGVEIHPGATLGRRLFIDHGMGLVIGETAHVGDDVVLFHGVTLGGTGKTRGARHPVLEDQVQVGAGAAILGAITVGRGARVGANAVVTRAVPPGVTVVGVPARPLGAPDDRAALEALVVDLARRVAALEAPPRPAAAAERAALAGAVAELARRVAALEAPVAAPPPARPARR